MKQAKIEADRSKPPSWYEEKVSETLMDFITELRSTKKEGYLKIKLSGRLSEGWPSDINNEFIIELIKTEPKLLWVDVDTMDIELPQETVIIQKEGIEVSNYFPEISSFSETIKEMHIKIRETLEEEASTLTGLLTPTQRSPLIHEWLKHFEQKKFKGA